MIDRAYFRFMSETEDVFPELDPVARMLLDVIAQCNVEPLTVTEAMNMYYIASPATIHRKLDELLTWGYMEHKHEAGNRRTKYLIATDKALNVYDGLSRAIRRAAK